MNSTVSDRSVTVGVKYFVYIVTFNAHNNSWYTLNFPYLVAEEAEAYSREFR